MTKRNEEYKKIVAAGTDYDGLIRTAADAQGIPYEFMHKLIFTESSFNNEAKSPTGPRGLGQFTGATGKAYGLITDEDFYNPQKSIPAIAAHIKDLSKSFGGDYLKVALGYNQGQGRRGAGQLAALDKGDFGSISEEGKGYMRSLLDTTGDSPNRKWFDQDQPGAYAPVGKTDGGDSYEAAMKGIIPEKNTSVNRGEFGESTGLNFETGAAPKTQPSMATLEHAQSLRAGGNKDTFEGTGIAAYESLRTSTSAQLFRNITQEDADPLAWVDVNDSSQFTAEDFEMIRKEGVDPQYFSFVLDNSRGKRSLLSNAIAMAKENQASQARLYQQGTGAQIVGGFAGLAGDPLTYAPIPGAMSGKLINRAVMGGAMGAGAGVASEALREASTGIEGHYGMAMIGGALLGGGISALLGKAKAPKPVREDMSDADMAAVLARHDEAGLPNEQFNLNPETDAGFDPASYRLEVRETARNTGADDISGMPLRDGEEFSGNMNGVNYVDHPSEAGAVRLEDGSIISADNPLNPHNIGTAASERAAKGVSMGGFTEIGYTITRSESQGVRDIGSQLMRSTTGTVSGSNGKFGATASDIVERLGSQDHVTYNRTVAALDEAMKDPKYAMASGSRVEKRLEIQRNISEAIEDSTGAKLKNLTDTELKLLQVVKGHFDDKGDSLMNPSKFGNPLAKSLMKHSRHVGHHIPNVYDRVAKMVEIKRFGSEEGLQDAIAASWYASYTSRPAVKARIDKFLKEQAKADGKVLTPKELDDAVTLMARDKAWGVAGSDKFTRNSIVDEQLDGLVGIENNNFLESRHMFDSDVPVMLSDGTEFRVNDLRDFDLTRIMPAYDRRINGDIGVMGATGKTVDEMKDAILNVKGASPKDAKALQEAMKILTGRARRDPDALMATALRSLTDASFLTKNAYMGVQNITEVAGIITKGQTKMLLKGIPMLKDMMSWGSKIKPKDLADMHGMVFGRELDDLIRPTRADIVSRLRDNAGANATASKVMGSIKWATGELSARSPFTKFLTESSNYIMDAGRQGFLMDFVNHTLKNKPHRLFNEKRLKASSITKDQYEGMKALINEHVVRQPDGSYKVQNAQKFQNDPRTMDLWRMGDKFADENILRPHKLSSNDTVAYGAMVKMAMQFKNFTMRSVNARLIRAYHNSTKNGRAIDETLQAVISAGLAGAMYMAMKYSQAVALPKDQREEFLKGQVNAKMFGYAALTRSSHIGAPFGIFNMVAAPLGFDMARNVRSSILPKGAKEKRPAGAMMYQPTRSEPFQNLLSGAAEQIPAMGLLGSVGQLGYNAAGLGEQRTGAAEREYMTGVYNAMRGMIPNDPASQFVLMKLMESHGVEAK